MYWPTGQKLKWDLLKKCPMIWFDANCGFSFGMLRVSTAGFPWKVKTGLGGRVIGGGFRFRCRIILRDVFSFERLGRGCYS